MRSVPVILLSVSFFCAFCVPCIDGFASWLKCYVELDEEEVVMHHPIVPAQNAREPVLIELQPHGESESRWIAGEEYPLDKGLQTILNNADGNDVITNTFKVRLQVPSTLRTNDVQYVVEVKGDGAAFIDLGAMCDGVRAFGRRHDEHVVLQINSTVSQHSNVELLAGWATGYEAVTLTRTMKIKRNTESRPDEQEL